MNQMERFSKLLILLAVVLSLSSCRKTQLEQIQEAAQREADDDRKKWQKLAANPKGDPLPDCFHTAKMDIYAEGTTLQKTELRDALVGRPVSWRLRFIDAESCHEWCRTRWKCDLNNGNSLDIQVNFFPKSKEKVMTYKPDEIYEVEGAYDVWNPYGGFMTIYSK